MAKKSGLGRGLDALFVDNAFTPPEGQQVVKLPLDAVLPDAEQHRKSFPAESLAELAASIELHGILQPLLVRSMDNGQYKIIAGERRYRAAKLAGLTDVPVIIRSVSQQHAAEMALIENLQREDLNPIDEAGGYETLIREHGLTQEEAAKRLGKSRVAIANTLRLLSLPSAAKSMVKNKTISAGHARALLSLKDEAVINRVLGEIVSKNLSVRETEALVKRLLLVVTPFRDPKSNEREITRSYLQELEKKASSRLGRSVSIKSSPQGNGSLQLLYKSSDDLEKLLISLCSEEIFLDSK